METALAWLGQLFETLLSFIPHIKIVRPTHAGVKFRAGRYVHLMVHNNGFFNSGIHFYWPILTEVEIVPIKRQTVNLVPQYISTKDDIVVGVSGIVVYEVSDVVKLLTECFDYDDTVTDFSLAAIKNTIGRKTYKEIQEHSKDFDINLTVELHESLDDYGIKIINATLTDFTKCRVFALWGSS